MSKTILYFTDLEGTILEENSGNYDDEQMFYFLEELKRLQDIRDSYVRIHIISPITVDEMEKIVNRINKIISNFNKNMRANLKPIDGAVASLQNNEYYEDEFRYDRISIFSEPIDRNNPDMGSYGKLDYVNMWKTAYKDLDMCIYAGNGRNDIEAMKSIKELGTRGIVICPKNSRTQVKEMANYVANSTDLRGIIECMKLLNSDLAMQKEENTKKEDYER